MKASMDELERALETARRRADPLAADRARISERLERELGTDVVLGPSRTPSPAPIVAARGGSLAAIVGTAVVTGVLGFVLGYGMGLGERSELVRAPEGPAQQVAAAASTEAAPGESAAPSESAAPRVAAPWVAAPSESAAPAMVATRAPVEEPARAMATTAASGGPPAPAPASQLAKPPHGPARSRAYAPVAPLEFAEVVERLRRANRALGDGKPLLTRLELDQLDRLAGDTLREERDMTRLLCACALGDVDDATRQARRLLGSSAGSIYAPRIEQSCAGTAATAR